MNKNKLGRTRTRRERRMFETLCTFVVRQVADVNVLCFYLVKEKDGVSGSRVK